MCLPSLERLLTCLSLMAAICLVSCGKKSAVSTPAPEPELAAEIADAAKQPDTLGSVAEVIPPPPPSTPVEEPITEVIDTSSKVSILGYHVFSDSENISKRHLPTTIFIGKFREQMQILKDNEISVIPMRDLLAWRRGEKNIPPFSVIITIDDGYVSTYDRAFPILKEFGFPFTIYPYTNFLGGAGRTLEEDEIKEMLAAGAELGSHGVSHGFLNRQGRRSDEIHAAFLKKETAESRSILKERLGADPVTFSYPYGAYDDRLMQACVDAGYEGMVTVKGEKVGWETDMRELGRYIVHGGDDRAFNWAISAKVPGGLAGGKNIMTEVVTDEATGEEKPLVSVVPADGSTIHDRHPIISVNLTNVEGLDPETLSMSISGIGPVIAAFNDETKEFSYQPVQRLRMPYYWVNVSFKREGKTRLDLVRWRFSIDAVANYLNTFKSLEPAAAETTQAAAESPQP